MSEETMWGPTEEQAALYASRADVAETAYRKQCAKFARRNVELLRMYGVNADVEKRRDQRRKDAADAAAWHRDEAIMYALLALMARPS